MELHDSVDVLLPPNEVYLLLERVAPASSLATSWRNRYLPQEREYYMELIFLLVVLGTLDIASLSWGFNSNDGFDSLEWERRQRWYGFH